MSAGSQISAVDYNIIRQKIINIMGTGGGQSGYGQTISSTDVAQGNQVTKDQWDALRFDILNARIHQDGIVPNIVEAVRGRPITYGSGSPNNQYNIQADLAVANKFAVGTSQFVIDTGLTRTRTDSWSTTVSNTVTVTFATADRARWFFNSGGKIRFTSSRTGGSNTAQNSSWSSLLAAAGTVLFGANTPRANFYNLTTNDQEVYSTTSSAPYSANSYSIKARCNVSNNSGGTANEIIFTIIWQDAYVDNQPSPPPDLVDGTLTLVIDELRAAGSLLPAGTFSIQRPSYIATNILTDNNPIYSLFSNQSSVNEGSSATFTVVTSNVANGTTLYWSTESLLGSVTTSDFSDSATTGSVTINNSTGSITRTIRSDATLEGTETFRILLRTGSTIGPIVASSPGILINDTSTPSTITDVICVSVIDECSQDQSTMNSSWNTFRSNYPNRPFYLLQPTGYSVSALKIPSVYNSDVKSFGPFSVNRDNGNTGQRSDWFAICNLNAVPSGTKIALAVDNSGSMTTPQVQASYNFFLQQCNSAGLQVTEVGMPGENWVQPFVRGF